MKAVPRQVNTPLDVPRWNDIRILAAEKNQGLGKTIVEYVNWDQVRQDAERVHEKRADAA